MCVSFYYYRSGEETLGYAEALERLASRLGIFLVVSFVILLPARAICQSWFDGAKAVEVECFVDYDEAYEPLIIERGARGKSLVESIDKALWVLVIL